MKYWFIWIITTLGTGTLLGFSFPQQGSVSPVQTMFMPGSTSHGHYQIELKCSACHEIGSAVREDACISCHGTELTAFNDTHPKSKFDDPSKFNLLDKIDARKCITCHREHVPEQTRNMGVTIPEDFCIYCHDSIGTDRPSHKDFKYDGCLSAGCHNYHDNTCLYENFLYKHADDPQYLPQGQVLSRNASKIISQEQRVAIFPDAPVKYQNEKLNSLWNHSLHARADVNCMNCHAAGADTAVNQKDWQATPDYKSCQLCHEYEVETFLEGHHGMKLATLGIPMKPIDSRLRMQPENIHQNLNCSTCHDPHAVDTNYASVDACLKCHQDEHSINYQESLHYERWKDELNGKSTSGTGVSCATCHMPRLERNGKVVVNHNQNANLRPNEKMIKNVCLNCHGLSFNLDAMADEKLLNNCFQGTSTVKIPSVEMAKKWFENKKSKNETNELKFRPRFQNKVRSNTYSTNLKKG